MIVNISNLIVIVLKGVDLRYSRFDHFRFLPVSDVNVLLQLLFLGKLRRTQPADGNVMLSAKMFMVFVLDGWSRKIKFETMDGIFA